MYNQYSDELHDYEQSAEEYFDNYAGEGFEGYEGHYDNYAAASVGRIDPNDRTYTIKVENRSGTAAEAVIFGGNENAAQPPDVTVEVGESSHNEVREESKSNPFKILGFKMSVSNPMQFDNVLKIVHKRSSGFYQERKYQPRNATSPQNTNSLLIDDEHFEMDVTGSDSLRLEILPRTTVVFTFTVKARANMGNLLAGRNVAEMSFSPRTTGLPQLDLIRKSPPRVMGMPNPAARPNPRSLAPRPAPRSGDYRLNKRDRTR